MPTASQPPLVIVLMGVSGSGKSTTGPRCRGRLGWPFRDADSFHPPANVEKMSRGTRSPTRTPLRRHLGGVDRGVPGRDDERRAGAGDDHAVARPNQVDSAWADERAASLAAVARPHRARESHTVHTRRRRR